MINDKMDSLDNEIEVLDRMDDKVFAAVQEMLKELGVTATPNDFTNEFLAEIRNIILASAEECFYLKD